MKWNFFETEFPKELLSADSKDLLNILSGPALIHIPGDDKKCFLVSCILHGNEITGWLVVRELLKKISSSKPKHSWLILIGNVSAAAQNLRQLPDGPDFNRVWMNGNLPENKAALEMLDQIQKFPIQCSIDIHNNTGRNPYYSCITVKDEKTFDLARTFSKQSLYFEGLRGTFTDAVSKLCPALSLEVGLPGLAHGVETVLKYLDTVSSKVFSKTWTPDTKNDLEIFRIAATLKVKDSIKITVGSDSKNADFVLKDDLDLLNFTNVAPNTEWAKAVSDKNDCFEAWDGNKKCTDDLFKRSGHSIVNTRPLMPAMITPNATIIQSDCVGYLLEKIK